MPMVLEKNKSFIKYYCFCRKVSLNSVFYDNGINFPLGMIQGLNFGQKLCFLAHLSRRLTRWAYSIPVVRRPSVRRRRPSSSSVVVVVHTFKLEYLWSQLANLDQILCVALLGWGKGCIRFWGRLDQTSGFYGNRKPPLTYKWEKRCLHLFWVVFDPILFILAGNEDMYKISDEFEFRPDPTTDYGVSCPWASKNFPIDLQWGNAFSMLAR